jgi:chemotaxis protein methyltransferase CheR
MAIEFLRRMGIEGGYERFVSILGTDIDFKSLDAARNGVYSLSEVSQIPPVALEAFFDPGQGELSGLYRVKDSLHRVVRFEQMNLLSLRPVGFPPDFVFLRNVLMYFHQDVALSILRKLAGMLPESSLIFLGLSESALGLQAGLESAGGRGVYRVRARRPA